MGAGLTGRKLSTFPGDLDTEVTINPEVKIRGGPCGYSKSLETVDDFKLNTHVSAKLRRAQKNRMNVKTSDNHKEFWHGQKKKKKEIREQEIQQLLTTIQINSFHGPARNTMSSLEISSKIIDSLLAAKETSEKIHLEFFKNRVTISNQKAW